MYENKPPNTRACTSVDIITRLFVNVVLYPWIKFNIWKGCRFSILKVSSCLISSHKNAINPAIAHAVKIERQPKFIIKYCPIRGATAGARTKIIIASDITRANFLPLYKSRTIAVPAARGAEIPKPWTNLATKSIEKFDVIIARILAVINKKLHSLYNMEHK